MEQIYNPKELMSRKERIAAEMRLVIEKIRCDTG